MKNADWNQNIEAGRSIEFGISSNTDFSDFPEEFSIIGENAEVNKADYSVQYQLDNDWGSGFTGRMEITNNTDHRFEDWVLEFDFDREITDIWNGVIEKHENNHYVIKNAGHNANIEAGQMITFGFNGNKGSKEQEPSNNSLYCYEQIKGNDNESQQGNG